MLRQIGMLQIRIVCFFLMLGTISYGQSEAVDWSSNYKLKLEDFQNPETEINGEGSSLFIQSGATIELAFQMNNLAFMFTKNFNNKILCKFYKESAVLVAPGSLDVPRLIKLAQFDFDLSELYARKIRKEIYENKKTFSKADFFEPYFNKMIAERNGISSKIYKASDFGKKIEVVEKEHTKVVKEIELLHDFCFDCKPPRKKRK